MYKRIHKVLHDSTEYKLSVYSGYEKKQYIFDYLNNYIVYIHEKDLKYISGPILIIDFKIESYDHPDSFDSTYIIITKSYSRDNKCLKIEENESYKPAILSKNIDIIQYLINRKNIDLYKIIDDWYEI